MNRAPDRRPRSRPVARCLIALAIGLAGCGGTNVETAYGRSRGQSINGTNVLADLIRARGHTVRTAVRYSDALGTWAQGIVRFAPHPGPPSRAEGDWLIAWLRGGPGRKLVYVVRDYDAGPEFWAQMLAGLPAQGRDDERSQIKARRAASLAWRADLPERAKNPVDRDEWFGTLPGESGPAGQMVPCKGLDGPWAADVAAADAALPRHEAIRAENNEDVLLSGDGDKLAVAWNFHAEEDEPDAAPSSVLVLANGAFTLNAGLLNRARRPLATRVVDWLGDDPTQVAFVEGGRALADEERGEVSPFHLLTVAPFNWVAAHLLIFGGLFAFSLATTLGRPRPEPPEDFERTSAHPKALGSILARTRQIDLAREILAKYRTWRHPAGGSERPSPSRPHPSPPRAPDA